MAALTRDQSGNLEQNAVADQMPGRVIDQLQGVHIDNLQYRGLTCLEQRIEPGLSKAPVGQTGQRDAVVPCTAVGAAQTLIGGARIHGRSSGLTWRSSLRMARARPPSKPYVRPREHQPQARVVRGGLGCLQQPISELAAVKCRRPMSG